MRIAFLGLGNMGTGMARNLLRAGHELVVYNRTRGAAETLAKEGARIAESPAEAAANREVAITMLSDDAAVESVVLGEHGVIQGLPSGSIHISSSTISPDLSERLLAAHGARGQEYLAAPVFGRPDAAAAAKLSVVVAGASAARAKAKPVFDAIAQRTFELDEHPAHANIAKLIGNYLITCVLESLGEAFSVARKANIDPNSILQILTNTLFNAPVYHTYGPAILEERFSPPGFKLPLGLKDNRLMLQAADKLGAPMPFAAVIHDRFLSAIANGHAGLDWSAMTLMIAQSAGLKSFKHEPQSEAAD
jgi:3-hydroxyisobutyrate dehydrogenase-like beta-hydroxyacid dehydrogenase